MIRPDRYWDTTADLEAVAPVPGIDPRTLPLSDAIVTSSER